MKKIILISGKAENGKSETAKIIKNELEANNQKVLIHPFAYHIKTYCKLAFPDWDGVTKTPEIRNFLQGMGTEVIRIGKNRPFFHCQRICEDIDHLASYFDYFIIDDLRFTNEFYFTKAFFPNRVIDINVLRENHVPKIGGSNVYNHLSENGLEGYTPSYTILNNKTGKDMLKESVLSSLFWAEL